MNRKHLHQQQRHKKIRQRVADKAEKAQKVVRKFIMPHRRQNAKGNGDQNGCHDGKRRQKQRCRELGNKGPEYIASGDVAHAHISGQKSAKPREILCQKRLVKPQLRPLGVDDLLRDCALVSVKLCNCVAARNAHHGKG